MLKSRDIQLTLLMLMSLMGFGAISWLIQNAGERGSGWIGTGNFTQPILFLSGAVFAAFISSRAGAKDGSPERVLKTSRTRSRAALERVVDRAIRQGEMKAESFTAACQGLFEPGGVREIAEAALMAAEKTFAADQASFMLLDDSNRLRIAASRGIRDEIASCVHLQVGERVSGLSIFERREFLIQGDLGNYPLFKDLESNPVIRSAMICPVFWKGEPLGVLNISRTLKSPKDFTQQDLRSAVLLAKQAGLALHHAKMCESLRQRTSELMSLYRGLKDSRLELFDLEKKNSSLFPRFPEAA